MKEERGNWGQGSIFRQKGSRFWRISYYRDGKHYRESSKSTRPNDAKSLLRKRMGQMEAGTFVSPKDRRITVNELVADLIAWYRNVQNKQRFANDTESRWKMHLQGFFDNMRAEQLGTDQIREYRGKRMAEKNPPSPVTVNRELQVLRKAFRLAAKATPPKVRTVPQFEMASEDNARKVFMDTATVDKLKQAASPEGLWARCFVEMIFTLGWRKGEVINLNVANVSLPENLVRIEHTKNGEPREAPLTQNLRVLLEPLVLGRDATERLFPVKDVRYAWRRICKAAGVKAGKDGGFVIHDSRRTTARTKRAAGVDQSVTMSLMGWKSDAMFRRYGIVDNRDKLIALQRAEAWEKQQQSKDMHTLCIDAPSQVQTRDKKDVQ
jgi:integrase